MFKCFFLEFFSFYGTIALNNALGSLCNPFRPRPLSKPPDLGLAPDFLQTKIFQPQVKISQCARTMPVW